MVARPPRADWGQGAGQGLVPRLADAPEDHVRDGGVPYCPCWGSPSGEHGVGTLDDPLWARGGSCGAHYVVVHALEDCAPDLRGGVVAVCRREGGVVIGGAEAGSEEGDVAGWCGGLFPLFRTARVCPVVFLCWGSL